MECVTVMVVVRDHHTEVDMMVTDHDHHTTVTNHRFPFRARSADFSVESVERRGVV